MPIIYGDNWSESPYSLLSGNQLSRGMGKNVAQRLHFSAEGIEDVPVTRVALEACSGTVFVGAITFSQGGHETVQTAHSERRVEYMFAEASSFKHFTVYFDASVCLSKIALFDQDGAPYDLAAPRVAQGTIHASSTLAPADSYDAWHLFDSREDAAWATSGSGIGASVTFDFDQPQNLSGLMIWNCYQRSKKHCEANARPKKISLTADGASAGTITLEDSDVAKIYSLPQPVHVKQLVLSIEEVYPGSYYKDTVISELRFVDGDNLFMMGVENDQNHANARRLHQLWSAGLGGFLNEVLGTFDDSLRWELFLSGDRLQLGHRDAHMTRDLTFVADMEISKVKEHSLVARAYGVLYVHDGENRIVEETLTIRRVAPNGIEVRNETRRSLPFRSVRFWQHM